MKGLAKDYEAKVSKNKGEVTKLTVDKVKLKAKRSKLNKNI